MKQQVFGILALFFYTEAVAYTDNQLANELAFAEHAVGVQLRQDKAPENLIKEESNLLSRAETAIRGKAAIVKGNGVSFLANHAQSSTQAAQALAKKVTHEVEFVAKAVNVQLEQDHAPASLVQEEKGLLTKAEAAAQNAERMLGKLASMKGRKHSMSQRSSAVQHSKVGSKTEVRVLDSVASQEAGILANERGQLKDLQTIEGEAQNALREIHASSDTKQKVEKLLGELKKDNQQLVSVEEKDLRNTKVLRNLRIKHSTGQPQAVQSTSVFANNKPTADQELVKIKELKTQSNDLHAQNERLKAEHQALEQNLELHLANDNAELAKQNLELEKENKALISQLNGPTVNMQSTSATQHQDLQSVVGGEDEMIAQH